MALYSGIVKVGADGTADVAFDIADFAGTVRVMAVGWSKGKVGHGTADVTVRDPVVLTATLPRFLLPGDRSSVHLDLDNVEGAAGDYTIAVTSADALSATSNQKLDLAREGARRRAMFRSRAAAAGNGTVRISVSGPGGFALQRSYASDGALAGRDHGAPDGQAARQRRKSRRCRATCSPISFPAPARCRFRSARWRHSTRRGCSPRSTAIRFAARSRSRAARCRFFMSAISPRTRRSRLDPATDQKTARRHRDAADAAGFERLVRLVERRRRRRLARLLRHGLPHPRARAQDRGAGRGVQARARPAAQRRSPTPRTGARTAAPISPTRSTCWRATASPRSAIFATSPTPSSMRSRRRSPRRKLPRRSPWPATARAPSAFIAAALDGDRAGFAARSDRPRGLRLDACAMPRRWSRSPAKAARARATVQAAVQRVEEVRANLRPTSTQEDAWLLLAASALAKDAGKVSLDVGGTADATRALPHHQRRRSERAVAHHQYRRGSGPGGGDGHRRADSRRSRRPKRASRSSARPTRSTAIRSMPKRSSRTPAWWWC